MKSFLKSILILFVVSIGIICASAGGFYALNKSKQEVAEQKAEIIREQHAMASCRPVIMYSLTYCGACKAKKKQLQTASVRFTAYEVDRSKSAQRRLYAKTEAQGWGRRLGFPILEINGKLYNGNTSLQTIKQQAC